MSCTSRLTYHRASILHDNLIKVINDLRKMDIFALFINPQPLNRSHFIDNFIIKFLQPFTETFSHKKWFLKYKAKFKKKL